MIALTMMDRDWLTSLYLRAGERAAMAEISSRRVMVRVGVIDSKWIYYPPWIVHDRPCPR